MSRTLAAVLRRPGMRLGPRKAAALAAGGLGLVTCAVVSWALGAEWAAALLAAGLAVALVAVSLVYVDLRRYHRAATAGRSRQVARIPDHRQELRELTTGVARLKDSVTQQLGELAEGQRGAGAAVAQLSGTVEQQLTALTQGHRRTVSLAQQLGAVPGSDGYVRSRDEEAALIRASGLFDPVAYQQEVGVRLTDPAAHYVDEGASAGIDPHPLFPAARYLERFPAALTRWRTPLGHFLAAERERAPLAPQVVRRAGDLPVLDDLRWDYLARGLHRQPDSFVLYRIIGNDLPPRHRWGQGLENLRFILEHEPDLPACLKRFVVNRIVDPQVEKQIIGLLAEAGVGYLHLPFDPAEYRRVNWRFDRLEPPGLTYRAEFHKLPLNDRRRILDHVYHDKNLYVMNNNGARNAALREGRQLAKWVLPWDGNCFLTAAAWDEFVAGVSARPYYRYFTVPMARVVDNRVLLRPNPEVEASEEPQLVFRRDAGEEFDPDSRYGRRPKVELFYRLRVPGPWDAWEVTPWDKPRPEPSPEAGQVSRAGWVARLFSGKPQLERDLAGRGRRRIEAIREQIDLLDEAQLLERYDPGRLFTVDDRVLADQRHRAAEGDPELRSVIADLTRRAEALLDRPVYCVTTKTSLPPSGDAHDYWHPAPYWWPNPDTPDGLPYVWRDGQRVPGTLLGEPGSEQYDRTALQSMIDESLLSALAGYLTGDRRYLGRGADLLRAWFLEPSTRMNPHLRYAQVRRGHDGDEGTPRGIIETNDFYYLLDAARLLEREGAFDPPEAAALREWFGEFRSWLHDSPQGLAERGSLNNHGTWYDVQLAAIDAYLGNRRGLLATLRQTHERVGQQFAPDGQQPEELVRAQSLHYCVYNLQGWVTLAGYADRAGQDLWGYTTRDGRGLGNALRWLFARAQEPSWPYPQQDPFDRDRLLVLAYQVAGRVPGLDAVGSLGPAGGQIWQARQVGSPHDGVRPFWALGSPPPAAELAGSAR